MMKALRKSGGQVAVCSLHVPPVADDEVRVRVRLAGLCRTDVQVARGELTCADPITLGHEFAGEIDAVGREVRRLTPGARVAIQPVLGCRTCGVCRAGDEINCPDRTMLGVDHNGAFAEFVVVPARCVFVLPGSLGWPAAALAVFNAGIQPGQQGLVLGRNRFAVLLERLLRAHGFDQITVCEPDVVDGFRPPDNSQDFVIETELPDRTLEKMIA
jgi:D-arabinose 1-dehydrogenase-like Zn-dependent alcohol dehydrogenase